jgi:hypothetical protein
LSALSGIFATTSILFVSSMIVFTVEKLIAKYRSTTKFMHNRRGMDVVDETQLPTTKILMRGCIKRGEKEKFIADIREFSEKWSDFIVSPGELRFAA